MTGNRNPSLLFFSLFLSLSVIKSALQNYSRKEDGDDGDEISAMIGKNPSCDAANDDEKLFPVRPHGDVIVCRRIVLRS